MQTIELHLEIYIMWPHANMQSDTSDNCAECPKLHHLVASVPVWQRRRIIANFSCHPTCYKELPTCPKGSYFLRTPAAYLGKHGVWGFFGVIFIFCCALLVLWMYFVVSFMILFSTLGVLLGYMVMVIRGN